MLLVNKGLLNVRNKYLIPRTNFSVNFNKSQYWSIKEVILKHIRSISKNGSVFEIEIPKELFLKAINCEIELFYTKAQVQMLHMRNSSYNVGCWPYVSTYYWLFFNVVVLQRNFYKGMLSFDENIAQELTQVFNAFTSEIIQFSSGSYFFSTTMTEYDAVILTLSPKKDFHKSTWSQMPSILREIRKQACDEEIEVLETIMFLFDRLSYNFPSKIRNDLNYKYDTAFYDLNKELTSSPIPTIDDNYTIKFVKKITKFDSSKNDLQYKIDCSLYIGAYLQHINTYLQNEFIDRSRYGIQFHKKRSIIGCV